MKYLKNAILFSALFVSAELLVSCKGKTKSETNSDTTINTAPQVDTASVQPAPVQISPDDSLNTLAKDAIKDYPDVSTSVSNGEITLTGTISRDKLPKLMQALHATHPKKINNNLTIK